MKALAVLSWVAVLTLAVMIAREPARVPAAARVLEVQELQIWQPAVAAAAVTSSPAVPVPAAQVPAAESPEALPQDVRHACARLGLFPDQVWAGTVARRLARAGADADLTLDWRLQAVGGKGYYVIFPGASMAQLAGRMVQRRSGLGRLLPAAVRPEACGK